MAAPSAASAASAAAAPSPDLTKRCFACLEEESAVPLLPCGCVCVNMFACAPCFLKVMANTLESGDGNSIACTVCRREFAAENAVAACIAAADGVAQLPWTAPERHGVELLILDVMLEKAPEAGYERTEHVMQECLRSLGPVHDATVKCAFLRVENLLKKEQFKQALALTTEWEDILSQRARSLSEEQDTHAKANALSMKFKFKSQKAACLAGFKSEDLLLQAELEFCQAADGLYEISKSASYEFTKTMIRYGGFMVRRTVLHFLEERRHTRQSSQLWKRAMSVVQAAVTALHEYVGQDIVATEHMERNLLILRQIGRDAGYEQE
jgi:hypothetical protein